MQEAAAVRREKMHTRGDGFTEGGFCWSSVGHSQGWGRDSEAVCCWTKSST